jgi:hypothetical protein
MEAHPGPPSASRNPPPSRGGGGSRGETQQARRSTPTPPVQRSSPPLRASPSPGVAGPAGRLAGINTLPGHRSISNTAPSWASVVRDGVRANHSSVSRQDFLALYERCSDSGLHTRLILRHQAGGHEISISCRLSAPPLDANAHPDSRRRKRAPAAAAPSPAPPTLTSASSQPPSTAHEASPGHPTETISPPGQEDPKSR